MLNRSSSWAIDFWDGGAGASARHSSLVGLRAALCGRRSGQLSGMAQGIGYSVASLGPLLLGLVFEHLTHSWDAAGGLFAIITLLALIAGLGAGRQGSVLKAYDRHP